MNKKKIISRVLLLLLVFAIFSSEPIQSSAAKIRYRITITWKKKAKKKPAVKAPSKPSHVKAVSQNSNTVKVTWNVSKSGGYTYTSYNGDGYQLSYATSKNGKYKVLANLSKYKVSYTHKNLSAGKTYYYKVKAYNKDGSKKKYSSFSKTASGKPLPAKTTGLKISKVGSDSTKLTWKKQSDVTGYKIYRAASSNGSYKVIKTIGKNSTVTYTDKNLGIGKTYYYKIKAYKKRAGKSYLGAFSAKVSKKLTVDAPTGIQIKKASPGTMNLSWKKSNDVTGYKLYRSETKNSGYKLVKTTGSGTLNYNDKGLADKKTYYYKVRAYKAKSGKEHFSSYTVIVSSKTGFSGETELDWDFGIDNSTIRVTWSKVSGATGYEVYCSDREKGTYQLIFTTSDTTVLHTDLKRDTPYYYKVRPFLTENKVNYYASYSDYMVYRTRDYGSAMTAEELEKYGNTYAESIGITVDRTLSYETDKSSYAGSTQYTWIGSFKEYIKWEIDFVTGGGKKNVAISTYAVQVAEEHGYPHYEVYIIYREIDNKAQKENIAVEERLEEEATVKNEIEESVDDMKAEEQEEFPDKETD